VLPDTGFADAAFAFAKHLAEGPPLAQAATKRILAAYRNGGLQAADAAVPGAAGSLFDSNDARNAIRSFLEHGPGRAAFTGD
jgi:enoyl-CoA hydratase/carnithine racemase